MGVRQGKEHIGGRERKISERQREMLEGKKQLWRGETDRGKEDQERCRDKWRPLKKRYDEDRTKMRETNRNYIEIAHCQIKRDASHIETLQGKLSQIGPQFVS